MTYKRRMFKGLGFLSPMTLFTLLAIHPSDLKLTSTIPQGSVILPFLRYVVAIWLATNSIFHMARHNYALTSHSVVCLLSSQYGRLPLASTSCVHLTCRDVSGMISKPRSSLAATLLLEASRRHDDNANEVNAVPKAQVIPFLPTYVFD